MLPPPESPRGPESAAGAPPAALLLRWLAGLEGVPGVLGRGGRIADLGCGEGRVTEALARAYPRACLTGLDPCGVSVARAGRRAQAAGLAARLTFACTLDPEGAPFDLVLLTRGLRGLDDPLEVVRRAAAHLAPEGTLLVVEPVGRSPVAEPSEAREACFLACGPVPAAPGRRDLGDQLCEARLREVLARAGFARVLRIAEPPTWLALQARLGAAIEPGSRRDR